MVTTSSRLYYAHYRSGHSGYVPTKTLQLPLVVVVLVAIIAKAAPSPSRQKTKGVPDRICSAAFCADIPIGSGIVGQIQFGDPPDQAKNRFAWVDAQTHFQTGGEFQFKRAGFGLLVGLITISGAAKKMAGVVFFWGFFFFWESAAE